MNFEEAAERIMGREGLHLMLAAVADFTAHHDKGAKRDRLHSARDDLKHAIVKALEEAARDANGKVTG